MLSHSQVLCPNLYCSVIAELIVFINPCLELCLFPVLGVGLAGLVTIAGKRVNLILQYDGTHRYPEVSMLVTMMSQVMLIFVKFNKFVAHSIAVHGEMPTTLRVTKIVKYDSSIYTNIW